MDLIDDVQQTGTVCVCRVCVCVCASIWAPTTFRRWSLIPVLPRCLWSEQPVSLIRPPEEVRKGAPLAALGLPSYFLTRRHAPLHGRVLRSAQASVSQWQVDRWRIKSRAAALRLRRLAWRGSGGRRRGSGWGEVAEGYRGTRGSGEEGVRSVYVYMYR